MSSLAHAISPPNSSVTVPTTAIAICAAGATARLSRNAGRYLRNYLSWRAIESVGADDHLQLAAFIHIPLLGHGTSLRKGASLITLEELVDAGEAMLMEMVKQARLAKA